MKIQDQVCTLEQAKKLEELGVSQDSFFSWCGEEGQRLMDNGRDGLAVQEWVFVANTEPVNNMQADHRADVPSARPFASAYTVAELGEMLPPGYDSMRISGYNPEQFFWMTYDLDGKEFPANGSWKTEAQARAAMLIRIIETKLVTVEEINNRLK